MTSIKALLVGGLVGILATLSGVSLARADNAYTVPEYGNDSPDHQGMYSLRSTALEASELCDVDGGVFQATSGAWVSYCNTSAELAFCEELSSTIDCSAMTADVCDTAMGDVFEGCLALSGMTGGAL